MTIIPFLFYTNQSFYNGKGFGSTDVDYVNNASTDLLQLSQVIVRIILKPTILIIKLNSKEGHSLELKQITMKMIQCSLHEFKQRQ
jgi:hypothetical protein